MHISCSLLSGHRTFCWYLNAAGLHSALKMCLTKAHKQHVIEDFRMVVSDEEDHEQRLGRVTPDLRRSTKVLFKYARIFASLLRTN